MARIARTKVTDELRAEVTKARKSGLHLTDIAARFKIAKSTVDRILRGPAPSAVKRLVRPSGPNVKYYAAQNGMAELDDLDEKIAELMERRKLRRREIMSRASQRERLRKFCQKYDLNRTDLYAVASALPLLRISRRSREVAAAKEGKSS